MLGIVISFGIAIVMVVAVFFVIVIITVIFIVMTIVLPFWVRFCHRCCYQYRDDFICAFVIV